jgi:hypothetical protein
VTNHSRFSEGQNNRRATAWASDRGFYRSCGASVIPSAARSQRPSLVIFRNLSIMARVSFVLSRCLDAATRKQMYKSTMDPRAEFCALIGFGPRRFSRQRNL